MDASDSRTPRTSLQHESGPREVFANSDTGEREARRILTSELGESVRFLFNRRVGSGSARGDIGIIVVAACGVFVLDPKAYWGRRVRANHGRDAFVISGRVRPAIADSMRRHLDAVRVAVADGPMPAVRVSGAFCFIGADLPLGRLVVDGVPATTLRGAVKLLKKRGPLTAEQRSTLHAYLCGQFPPA